MGAAVGDKVKKDAEVVCSGLESQQTEEILFFTSNTKNCTPPPPFAEHLSLHLCLQRDNRASRTTVEVKTHVRLD